MPSEGAGAEGAGQPTAPRRYKSPSRQDLEAYLFDFGLARSGRDELEPV